MRTHRFVLAAAISVGAFGMAAGGGPAAAGPVTVAGAEHAAPAQVSSPRGWQGVVDRAARTLTAATPPGHRSCAPIRPETSYYEGGRVASEELTTPASRCTTISVSHVVDPTNPADRCQTFLLGFWPLVDGSLTYTEPVTACGQHRTVLARNVPNNARYLVLYNVDYIEPDVQQVDYKIWH